MMYRYKCGLILFQELSAQFFALKVFVLVLLINVPIEQKQLAKTFVEQINANLENC